jgi:hypothetical protein
MLANNYTQFTTMSQGWLCQYWLGRGAYRQQMMKNMPIESLMVFIENSLVIG